MIGERGGGRWRKEVGGVDGRRGKRGVEEEEEEEEEGGGGRSRWEEEG